MASVDNHFDSLFNASSSNIRYLIHGRLDDSVNDRGNFRHYSLSFLISHFKLSIFGRLNPSSSLFLPVSGFLHSS